MFCVLFVRGHICPIRIYVNLHFLLFSLSVFGIFCLNALNAMSPLQTFCIFKIFVICDALRDLVAFVQFKKREKHPWRSVY